MFLLIAPSAAQPAKTGQLLDYADKLSCDNCIYGVLLDYKAPPKPTLIIWVEDDLIDQYWQGHNLEMVLDKPLDAKMLPIGSIAEMRRKSCVFSFTESCGHIASAPTRLSHVKTLTIDATNLKAPFKYQQFNLDQVKALKQQLMEQKKELLATTREHIRKIWSEERLNLYCMPIARGIDDYEISSPDLTQQDLYIPDDQTLLYPESSSKLKLAKWSARVSNGKVTHYEIELEDHGDIWLIRQNVDEEPLSEDAILARRIYLNLSTLMSNQIYAKQMSELTYPSSKSLIITKDKAGTPTGFIDSGKPKFSGTLDSALQIKAVFIDGKEDLNWRNAIVNQDSNYKRHPHYKYAVRKELIQKVGPLIVLIDNGWLHASCTLFPMMILIIFNWYRKARQSSTALETTRIGSLFYIAQPAFALLIGFILATALCYLKEQRTSVDLMMYVERNCYLFIIIWNALFLYMSFFSFAMAYDAYKIHQFTNIKQYFPIIKQYFWLCCKTLLSAVVLTIVLAFIWSKIAPRPWSG